MKRITPSLAMLSLLFVGACGEQSSIAGPRPAASARFDLSSNPPTAQTFCSGGTVGGASNLAVSGTGAAAAGFVPNQAQVPWTGTAANLTVAGVPAALWVVPFGPSAATNNKGANQDAFDNTDYTYSIQFTVPAGFTADLSGSALRDNSDTITVDGTAITGSEIHNNSRANFGAGVSLNPPLPAAPPVAQSFSTTGIAAGLHTVSFLVWNENLSALNNGVLFPNPANAARTAPNPTGIIFCFTVTPKPIVITGEGCSPGYYKKHDMPGGGLLLSAVFDNDGTSGVTLKQALDFKGGPDLQDAKNILLRQAAAAYANSIRLAPAYPLTTAQVVTQTNAALASGDRDTILAFAGVLDGFNNLEGPRC